MKTSLLCGAALAILGLAAAPVIAQTQTTSSSSSSGYVQTSKIVGTKVKTAQGEEVGVVKDVVLDRSNGCMAYTVLSTGGTGSRITGSSKLVAVPWSVYSVAPDMSYVTVQVDRDRIYNAPAFEYSRISDPSYTSTVYSTFGVSASVGVSSATTTGTSTQTQTGAYASPGASAGASPSPAASLTPSTGASASAAPSASASASPATSATASSKSTHNARTGTSPVSPRHKGNEAMQGTSGESTTSEASESPSTSKSSKGSKKSSVEKSTSAESSSAAESSESPSGKKSSKKKSTTEEAEPTPGGEQE